MGWMAVLAIKPMLATVPCRTLLWLLAGGLAYTARHAVLHEQAPHAHAIWHGFVLVGSACHFVAVAMQVLGYAGGSPESGLEARSRTIPGRGR